VPAGRYQIKRFQAGTGLSSNAGRTGKTLDFIASLVGISRGSFLYLLADLRSSAVPVTLLA
jgi:hypothetical protein